MSDIKKQTSKTSRVIQRADRVISLRLRDGRFALMQILNSYGQLAVFNVFRAVDQWDDIELTSQDVLFTCCVIKSFFRQSDLFVHKEVKPLKGISYPEVTLNSLPEYRRVRLWENTPEQRETLIDGGEGKLGLHRSFRTEEGAAGDEFVPINLSDYSKYMTVQTSRLRGYPELNERILLCAQKGKDFDPLRELMFDRPLDIDCAVYVDIIGGRVLLSELGY